MSSKSATTTTSAKKSSSIQIDPPKHFHHQADTSTASFFSHLGSPTRPTTLYPLPAVRNNHPNALPSAVDGLVVANNDHSNNYNYYKNYQNNRVDHLERLLSADPSGNSSNGTLYSEANYPERTGMVSFE